MSVLVKNETGSPWVFDGSRGSRQIPSGAVSLISDEEWASIISAKRGPGGINALWPDQITSDSMAMKLDYYLTGGVYEVRYIGFAVQGVLSSDAHWAIKRFGHTAFAGANQVTEIQVLKEVVWDDRASLPWS